MVEAATASLAGFVYALPGQNSSALCSSRFAGPYTFTAAPLALTADAETAFKLLSLSTLPQQVQPAQPRRQPPAAALPPPQQQQRPALQPVQPPLQQPAAGRQPIQPPVQPVHQRHAAYAAAGGGQAAATVAGTSGASAGYRASAAGQADPEDAEDDAFYGAIDVESIVQQAASRRPAATATQHSRQHPPGLNTSTQFQQQQQRQQQQQQQQRPGWPAGGPGPAPTSQQLQHPPAAAAGPLCSHGVPIASCPHRQLHLEDIVRQVSEVGLQFADADESQTAALKLEMKRLRDLKHMLEAAPPLPMVAHAAGMPAGAGMRQVQQPQQQHQHQHQPQYAQQQQQQQPYTGAQPAAGYGGGGGMSAQSFQPRPANGEYGGGANGGGSGGFNGGSGTFGGGGGGYEAGPPLPLWQPDAGALQGVAAEREDASGDMKWRQEAFPWSSELRQRNREAFGNKDFRANQLQIMNATLSRRDVFVLMPTGGGKSLCYQLPALLSAGVTVVVSPLVSLIQDQVHHLTVLGINAACVGGSVDWEEQRRVYASLMEADGCKVLFITPEKLAASGKLQSTLDSLHQRGLLARVCIDEAHCVSQWGHDFRKDYTRLSFFKQRFPSVPLLALTATATQRVQHDVVAQLGIQHCLMFKSSFNRPNLRYEVRKKKKGCVDEMAELVLSKFTTRVQAGNKHSWSVQCGIVYCLSRAECERVADELEAQLAEGIFPLRNGRRRVKHYHASLSPEEREAVQAEWTNGDVPVIVATIAFGMGINKADVRFVFHYSLPKSLEGYLQESGRAGRDGRPSTCILYYTYGDAAKTRHMIRSSAQENGSPEEQVRSNMESLNAMINYCEEQVECRRVLMLSHFGEGGFSRSQCRATCDNCRAGEGMSYAEVDVSEAAKKIIEVVRCIGRASVAHVVDVFRGNNTVGVRKAGHGSAPVHGIGKACCRNNGEAERLVRRMVVRGYLTEETHRAEMHMAVLATLAVNEPAAALLFSGQLPMKMHVQQKGGSSGKAGASGKGRAARTPSTAAAALTVTTAKTAGAAAAAPARGGAAAGFGSGAVQRRQAAPAEPLVISIEDSEDDDDEELRQRTAVLAAAMKQLSTALRQHRDLPRAPLTTSVQSKIAALGFLTTLQQFMDAEVTGMSDSMKRKYGQEIVAASCQAAAFLPAMLEGRAQLHEFELDLGAVFAGQKAEDAAQAKRRRETDGWSDDEDDDWVEGTKPSPHKHQRVGGQAAAAAAAPAPNLQAFRCGGAPAGAAGVAAAGAYRPQQGGAGSGRVVAGGVQAAPWPVTAHAQQQQQQHGQHQQQQHGQYQQQQGQYQGTAGGVQRPVPRPTSAGPFGRREGVSYNHASSGGQAQAAAQRQQPHLQQQQQQPAAADASPQWRHRKGGGGGGGSTHPAGVRHGQHQPQHQQQQQGQHGRIETTVVQNITGAFGGGCLLPPCLQPAASVRCGAVPTPPLARMLSASGRGSKRLENVYRQLTATLAIGSGSECQARLSPSQHQAKAFMHSEAGATDADTQTQAQPKRPRLSQQSVYICGVARTPLGSFMGGLSELSATELGAIAIKAAVQRAGVPAAAVGEVYMGNVCSAGLGQAPARQASLRAGLPLHVDCTTVNKVCSSGMKAMMLGAQSIMLGARQVVVAGGMESMSNIPHYAPGMRAGTRLGHSQLLDGMLHDGLWDATHDIHMGECAEMCAERLGISREAQDAHAVESAERAQRATAEGLAAWEVAPVEVAAKGGGKRVVKEDEAISKMNPDKLRKLKPFFRPQDGTVTAGNASPISDGAAAVVLASGAAVRQYGLPVLGRILGFGDAAVDPRDFPTAPSQAIPAALEHAGVAKRDVEYWEVNEAFSVVDLANRQLLGLDPQRVNVFGGAVAIGHPIGASGCRLIVTLLNVLRCKHARLGVAAICNGGGGASAMVIEQVDSVAAEHC